MGMGLWGARGGDAGENGGIGAGTMKNRGGGITELVIPSLVKTGVRGGQEGSRTVNLW